MNSDAGSNAGEGPPAGAPRVRKRRRLWRILAWAAVGVVVLAAAAPTLVSALGKGSIEAAARKALETDVSIGSLALGWLSGLEVADIEVKPSPDGAPGLKIGSISGKPNLGALIQGRVEVKDLVIRHVTLDVTKSDDDDEDEEDDDDEASGKALKDVPAFAVRATIEDVTVVVRAREWGRPVRIERVGPLMIAASSSEPTHVDLTVASGIGAKLDVLWCRDGKKLRRRDRRVTGELRCEQADLASLSAACAPWVDVLRGVLHGTARFELAGKDLATSGDLRVSRLAVGLRGAAEPHVFDDVSFVHDVRRAAGGDLQGAVDVMAGGGRLAPLGADGRPLVVRQADLRARLSGNTRVDVERLHVAADFGSIEAKGRVASGREPLAAEGDVRAKASVDALAAWLGGMPEISGALTSDLRVTLAPDGALAVRGATEIADFVARAVPGAGDVREKAIVLKHDFDYGDGAVSMRDVGLKSSFATASCTGSLRKGDGAEAPEGQVDLVLGADLDVIAGLLGERLPIRPRGRLTAASRVTGAAAGTSFDVRVNGRDIVLAGGPFAEGPLDLGAIEASARGTINGDRTGAAIPEWSFESRACKASGSANLSAAEGEKRISAAFDVVAHPDVVLPAVKPLELRTPVGPVTVAGTLEATDAARVVTIARATVLGLEAEGSATLPEGKPTAFTMAVKGPLDRALKCAPGEATGSGSVHAVVKGALGDMPVVDASVKADELAVRLAPDGASVAGNVAMIAKIDAVGAFDARVDAPALTFAEPPRKREPGKSVTGAVQCSARGVWDAARETLALSALEARAPGTTLTGRATVQPGREAAFDVKMEVLSADAGPLLRFFAPSLEVSGSGTVEANGVAALGDGAGPRDARADLRIRMDGLKADALDLRDVDVQAALADGVARTKKATANLNGGTATLDGTIDFRPELPTWKGSAKLARVAITKEMQPAIARAIPLFSGLAVTVGGTLGGDFDVSGRGQSWDDVKPTLTGTGLLDVDGATLSKSEILDQVGAWIGLPRDLRFDDFETRFRIQDGAVEQDRLVLSSEPLDVRMSGRTSLAGRLDYQIGFKAKGGVSDKWKALGKARLLDKDGFLPARIGGDVTKPSIKLPKPEDVLGGAIEDVIKGGIEDLLKKKLKKD